jgi:hypothetical protein
MRKSEQERIEALEEEIRHLREAVQFLAHSKQQNKKYAFFDWLVINQIFGTKRARLDGVLMILDARLNGERLPRKKRIPGTTHALLYREGAPTYEEAKQLLMEALEVKNDTIVDELLDALKKQGIHKKLSRLKPPSR